jgi:ABC-type transporter Mla subunit MlaD
LNNYVDKTEKVATEMSAIIDSFKDFNTNLKVISNNTVSSIELQKQFKDSLEIHFPTINDHREVWRSQVDELNQDIKSVYSELNTYFRTSTEQIQSFIGSNNNFFTGINEIQNAIQIFVENSSIQKDEFNILKNQIVDMRNDFKDSQKQSIETNKALIDAIIDLKKTISKIEIPTEK